MADPQFLLLSDARLDGIAHADDSPSSGAWRFVLESLDGTQHFAAYDEEVDVSSERLELLSVVRGLEALDQPSEVTLVTASRYVTRGIRFGLPSWRENGWQWEHFGRMTPVPNADLWQRVDQALNFHEVRCRALRLEGASWSAAEAVETPHEVRLTTAWSSVATWGRAAWQKLTAWVAQPFVNPSFQICPQ